MSTSASTPQVGVRKHFTSSILLWMRTDEPRQKGMDQLMTSACSSAAEDLPVGMACGYTFAGTLSVS